MNQNTDSSSKHPPGLYVLFFTEMWERFGYYTMMAILALYMDEHLKLPKAVSGNIYGLFSGLVYFTPLLGGLIADKWLGFRRSILIGAMIMSLGYWLLALDKLWVFYLALLIIAMGNSLFKPNISNLVGNLYAKDDPKKDYAFNIFYMGINIGALIAPLAASFMRTNFGWSYAFGAAGAGMVLSLIIFQGFKKYYSFADTHHLKQETKIEPGCAQENARIISLVTIFIIVILFWMAFFQNGFTLTFWARDCTLTSLKPEVFQFFNPAFIILGTPLLILLWKALKSRNAEPSTPAKIGLGMLLTALAYLLMYGAAKSGGDYGKVSMIWLVASYCAISFGELCISPMGLAFVNKIAPPRMRGLMMGGWFAVTGIGGYLSGFLGTYWETMPHSRFFLILVATSLFAALLIFLALKKIKAATCEA